MFGKFLRDRRSNTAKAERIDSADAIFTGAQPGNGGVLHSLANFARDKSGSYMVLTALGMPVLIGAAALGTEAGFWMHQQQKMQDAADSAVFAAATYYGPNPDSVSCFAAQRTSDGALTVMVISKYLSGSTPVTVNLSNFTANGVAQRWQLTSSNAITHLADLSFTGSRLPQAAF